LGNSIQRYIFSKHFIRNSKFVMTKLGNYLTKKSVNKSEISRRSGISKSRMSELTHNSSTKIRAEELFLIALAINVDPCEILLEIFGQLKLNP